MLFQEDILTVHIFPKLWKWPDLPETGIWIGPEIWEKRVTKIHNKCVTDIKKNFKMLISSKDT
jgi:hypothetical protein